MGRRIKSGLPVALLLAVASIVVASASSSPTSSGENDDDHVEVIRATGVLVSEAFLDLDGSGDQNVTVGDQAVFTSDLVRNGKKIGLDGGFCTLVRLPALFQCVGTNHLPGGQLTVTGLLDYGPEFANQGPFHLAITGGTGRYKDAHGQVVLIDRAPPARDSITFRIIR